MKDTPNKIKVAFLLHVIAPYRFPLYQRISSDKLFNMKLFIEEENPSWRPGWEINNESNIQCELVKSIIIGKPTPSKKEERIISFSIDLLPRLVRFRPDVIVTQEFGLRTLISLFYKLLFRTKIIVAVDGTLHSESQISKIRHLERKFISKFSDAFIVLGKGGIKYLDYLKVPKNKIHIVPLVTDNLRFTANSEDFNKLDKKTVNFVHTGRLVNSKGIREMLDVWLSIDEEIRSKSILNIIGWGPLEDEVKMLSEKKENRINFLGKIDYTQMHNAYKNADFFIFPTLSDPWGLVVNEALASGLPVLCSKYAGAEDLINHKINGYTFDPLKKEEFIDAIKWAYNNYPEIETLRQSVFCSIKNFDFSLAYSNFKDVVLEIV